MYEIRETLLKIKGCTYKITLFLAAYCSLQQTWYQIDDWDVKQQTQKNHYLKKVLLGYSRNLMIFSKASSVDVLRSLFCLFLVAVAGR